LKEKKIAEDRAKTADKSLSGLKDQVKKLQDEVDGLKDSINKARDLTEEKVRKAEKKITKEWEIEKDALV